MMFDELSDLFPFAEAATRIMIIIAIIPNHPIILYFLFFSPAPIEKINYKNKAWH